MPDPLPIESAQYTHPANLSTDVTYTNGKVMAVPSNESNRHFRQLVEWVDQGGVIAPYETPPEPDPETDTEKMERINSLSVGQMRDVLGIVGGGP